MEIMLEIFSLIGLGGIAIIAFWTGYLFVDFILAIMYFNRYK